VKIDIITTGGTIDKVYFDEKSEFAVGESPIREILTEANVTLAFEVVNLLRKDSLELTDADRDLVRRTVESREASRIVVTHGTDTMVETAKALQGLPDKTVVLTGSLSPARFRNSDAVFNVGTAIGAVQCLPEGVYLVMNGRIFQPERVRKNRDRNRFEEISE
jgi:L-asparaginase